MAQKVRNVREREIENVVKPLNYYYYYFYREERGGRVKRITRERSGMFAKFLNSLGCKKTARVIKKK